MYIYIYIYIHMFVELLERYWYLISERRACHSCAMSSMELQEETFAKTWLTSVTTAEPLGLPRPSLHISGVRSAKQSLIASVLFAIECLKYLPPSPETNISRMNVWSTWPHPYIKHFQDEWLECMAAALKQPFSGWTFEMYGPSSESTIFRMNVWNVWCSALNQAFSKEMFQIHVPQLVWGKSANSGGTQSHHAT